MKLKQTFFLILALALMSQSVSFAQVKRDATNARLLEYFESYTNDAYSNAVKTKVEDIVTDDESRRVDIYVSEVFLFQPFTPHLVKEIYNDIKGLLPAPYNTYFQTIYAKGTPIELLIPADLLGRKDSTRTYSGRDYHGNAWVTPLSLPYSVKNGLQGRHLAICQSHGRYYADAKQQWEWQRPNLYCTTEDLFTQSFVVPYLMPMLERAGAIVYTPRERDWQKREIIVDNDAKEQKGTYTETTGKYEWLNAGEGFAQLRAEYVDGDNPFKDGTSRRIEAQNTKRMASTIRWQPQIDEEGDYAVYVSYKTLLNSVSDATYTVRHEGISTEFRVNQQMGGSTWVYLGTFHFKAGCSYDNCVTLSNISNYRGVITADAVRFGGGMGNVARGSESMEYGSTSGLPRCLEAARYSALWYGMPRDVYNPRDNDYNDDIVVRPYFTNYLSRGSVFHPGEDGLKVPLELSLSVHTDAGYRMDNSLIGTLGIYTSEYYDGQTAAGLSRLSSRDLVDAVMTQISTDITKTFGGWNRRQIFDRNYGETREPQVPSIILEMLSHQSFADMRLGHDPFFKFVMSRAIYKGILRYISFVHGLENPVVQPMPVTNLAARLLPDVDKVQLSWDSSYDENETSAKPTHYIIYRAEGDKGFDNGILVSAEQTSVEIDIQRNVLYRFAVAASNAGGASGKSEEVCAYKTLKLEPTNVLIMDGFQRVAGPLSFDTGNTAGFDMATDPGVADIRTMAYCGYQRGFDKSTYGKIAVGNFGDSGSELEGMVLAGNTHNYTTLHARDILASPLAVNISSCVGSAVERMPLNEYKVMDIAMGAQKADGYSLRYYKTFIPSTCETIRRFTQMGGRILLSGAFIGTDMQEYEEKQFTHDVLKYDCPGGIPADSIGQLTGMNTAGEIYCQPNEKNYWVRRTDVLNPTGDAFCTMLYSKANQSAAVAYPGQDYKTISYGFPLECITDESVRRNLFDASLRFLIQ